MTFWSGIATRRSVANLFLILGCICAPISAAQALVVVPADFNELVRSARVIVHGTVVGVSPQVGDDRRHIDTLVSLEVAGYLKGDFGPEVTVRVPGGEVGRYRTVIPGAPTFKPGDEVVLFLQARGPVVPYLLGLSQGVYRIVRDAKTGEDDVIPPPVLGESSIPRRVIRGDPGHVPMALSQFSTIVRQRVVDSR